MLPLLLLQAAAQPAPVPDAARSYFSCVVDAAERYAQTGEATPVLIDAAAYACRSKRREAAKAVAEFSNASMQAKGWPSPGLGDLDKLELKTESEAKSAATQVLLEQKLRVAEKK